MILNRLGMLALFGICGFTSYYLFEHYYDAAPSQITPDAEKPLFTASDISTIQYDEWGVRSYNLQSVHLEYFKKRDETHFTKPILWTFYQGKEKEWQVISDIAVLHKKHILTMSGNVKIYNLLPDAQISLITTDELTLDLSTRDFWSDKTTEITGERSFSRGLRVTGNFGTHQMDMIEEVKSIYEAKNK